MEIANAVALTGGTATVVSVQDHVLELAAERAPGARRVRAGSDAYARAPSRAARAVGIARTARELRRAIAASGADVLHVNNGGYPGTDLGRLAILLAGRSGVSRRLMSVHSQPWSREDSQPQLQAGIDRLMWRSLDAVLGATEIVGRMLRELRGMPPELYRLVPYGVSEPEAGGAEELRAQLAPDREPLVGMISAGGDPAKGHAVLADAIARCGVPLRAVIVGTHPGPSFEAQLEQLGIARRVTLAGRVPSVGPYLHALDALVIPSTEFESLPLVALEAMAAGRAVIASRLAGLPEAVVDGVTGRLAEPGDAESLAQVLRETAADRPALARMGAAGRLRWEERYSVEAMTAATLGVYAEAGGRRSTVSR